MTKTQEHNFENEGDPHLYDSYIQNQLHNYCWRQKSLPTSIVKCLAAEAGLPQQGCGTKVCPK